MLYPVTRFLIFSLIVIIGTLIAHLIIDKLDE
jgi:hypothetical protein